MKKFFWIGIGLVVVLFSIFLLTKSSSENNFDSINAIEGDIKIYKSVTCGCCEVYVNYVDSKVKTKVNNLNVQDPNEIKRQYKIPQELESCHTTIIGDYFVEGHIPLEAVEKLLKEQPNVTGIAMPGMPSGSPGMPGQKYRDFIIYAVNSDGTYYEFMRI